jgi:hypothetical protein
MKKFLAFLLGFARNRDSFAKQRFHDDSLRANQGQGSRQTFSFWRSLVS